MKKGKEKVVYIDYNLIRHKLALLHVFLGLLPIIGPCSDLRP